MSVVIVGGHDRMVSQYVKICKSFNCKAKVFTQMTADFGKQIGAPDLLVLFTSTAVHRATVIIRITEILPSRFLLKMRYMKRMIDQLSDSFILCR